MFGSGEYHRNAQKRMAKTRSSNPAGRLRSMRERRGLTLRDVHSLSLQLAERFGEPAFVIPPSRLHEFETTQIVPSVHRLCTLARVYKCSLKQILSLYDLPPR